MYIKPIIVAIDETRYWDTRLANKAGKIYGIWIYDSKVVTHCCSFSGSYWLEPIDVIAVNDCGEDTRDEINQQFNYVTEANYYDESDIDKIPDDMKVVCPTYRCRKEDYDETWREIVENYVCNPMTPKAILEEETNVN